MAKSLKSYMNGDIVVKDKNVGIENITASIQTSVYPNPANTEISILSSENLFVEITDISGKVVTKTFTLQANSTHKISVSEYTTGVYLVRMFNDNFSKTERVVINN